MNEFFVNRDSLNSHVKVAEVMANFFSANDSIENITDITIGKFTESSLPAKPRPTQVAWHSAQKEAGNKPAFGMVNFITPNGTKTRRMSIMLLKAMVDDNPKAFTENDVNGVKVLSWNKEYVGSVSEGKLQSVIPVIEN